MLHYDLPFATEELQISECHYSQLAINHGPNHNKTLKFHHLIAY